MNEGHEFDSLAILLNSSNACPVPTPSDNTVLAGHRATLQLPLWSLFLEKWILFLFFFFLKDKLLRAEAYQRTTALLLGWRVGKACWSSPLAAPQNLPGSCSNYRWPGPPQSNLTGFLEGQVQACKLLNSQMISLFCQGREITEAERKGNRNETEKRWTWGYTSQREKEKNGSKRKMVLWRQTTSLLKWKF